MEGFTYNGSIWELAAPLKACGLGNAVHSTTLSASRPNCEHSVNEEGEHTLM